jgi:hypothetical protein
MKRNCGAITLSVLLFLSLLTVTVPSVASPLQVVKLMDKPAWAGSPGGPNGGGGEEPTGTYVLHIEIDYMVGHEPTDSVLTYIHDYYYDRGIEVTFTIDDVVEDPTPADNVTESDFWAIEDENNDIGDDSAAGNPADGVYTSKWKWVLFGTTVDGYPDVVGYCWVVISGKDYLAGNYLFIADEVADEVADEWSSTDPFLVIGAEATVLMHEMGHSIGIGKLHPRFGEKYDPDSSSVMSYLSPANAGQYMSWYYSDAYWATRNLEYYEEALIVA